MSAELFTDGISLPKGLYVQLVGRAQRLTIAQQCQVSLDPYAESVKKSAYKGMPSSSRKVFHFEDGSYLAFDITYTPAESGRSFPCPVK